MMAWSFGRLYCSLLLRSFGVSDFWGLVFFMENGAKIMVRRFGAGTKPA